MRDYRGMQAQCEIAKGIEELVEADIKKMARIIGDPRITCDFKFWDFRPRKKPKTQGAPYPHLFVKYLHGSGKVSVHLVRQQYFMGGWDREERVELSSMVTTPDDFTKAMTTALKKARKMLQESQAIDAESEVQQREFFALWGR